MKHKSKYFSFFILIFLFLQIFPQQAMAKIGIWSGPVCTWQDYSGVTYLMYGLILFGLLLLSSIFFFFRKKNLLSIILLGMSVFGTIICISLIIFAYTSEVPGDGRGGESGFFDSIKVSQSNCDNP